MPWLENRESSEREERQKQMFRELARMHTLSLKEIEVEKDERKEHYERTLSHGKLSNNF